MIKNFGVPVLVLFSLVTLTCCATLSENRISAPVPYVTTPPNAVTAMLKLADVTSDDTVYDLGSGDGRIVIAAARDFGARAVGVEIDPALIQQSERNAETAGVTTRVSFLQKDLFQADVSEATVVTLFLLPGVNTMLAPKFLKELRPGTRIVSYLHDMGEWQPDKTARADGSPVYLWIVPAEMSGAWTLEIPTAQALSPQSLFFKQAFQKLSGSVKLPDKRLDLREPRIDGDKLYFAVSGTVEGKPVLMTFSGRVQGGRASGDVVVNGGTFSGTHQWTAQRSVR